MPGARDRAANKNDISLMESVLYWERASAVKINDNPTRTSYSGVVGNAVKKQYGREDMWWGGI